MANSISDYEALEQSIDALIQGYRRAQAENAALQKKMQSLNHEKVVLGRKNDEARRRIEIIVKQLKQSVNTRG